MLENTIRAMFLVMALWLAIIELIEHQWIIAGCCAILVLGLSENMKGNKNE